MKTVRSLALAAAATLAACSAPPDAVETDDANEVKASTFELFFTNPLPDLVQRGQVKQADAEDLIDTKIAGGPAPDARLVQLIDATKGHGCSVLVADYDFNLQNIADAMVRAKGRGCDVRMVTDGDTVDRANPEDEASQRYGRQKFDAIYEKPMKAILDAGIPVHDDGARGAIMHNKFVVLNGKTVWTGSWNMSQGDLAYWNHAFVVRSPDLAVRYGKQFEFLYSHFAAAHTPGGHVIDVDFVKPVDHNVTVGTTPFEVFFPKNDKATTRVAELVASAKTSIHFMAFQFTGGAIADAVVERAAHGVEVKGVFENNGACAGAFPQISAAPGNVELSRWTFGRIQGLRNFLHHKVFILDGKTVVLGSFNFSQSADDANDENLLVVTDPGLAKSFEDEYQLVAKATKLAAAPAACKPHTIAPNAAIAAP